MLGVMDEASKGIILRKLQPSIPLTQQDQKIWFLPYLGECDSNLRPHYNKMAKNLKRTLVFNNGLSPIGLLRSCLDYSLNSEINLTGVFEEIKNQFKAENISDLFGYVTRTNEFRNKYVAHQEDELNDIILAERELKAWIMCLKMISKA